jgi:hypothetical protein
MKFVPDKVSAPPMVIVDVLPSKLPPAKVTAPDIVIGLADWVMVPV